MSHVILASILVLLCASGSAFAQDAGMSDIEIVDAPAATDGVERVYTPGEEIRYIPHATGIAKTTDSVVLQIQDFPMQQATMKPETSSEKEGAKQKDDSILTFNFLYYIIQKYKLQDIID